MTSCVGTTAQVKAMTQAMKAVPAITVTETGETVRATLNGKSIYSALKMGRQARWIVRHDPNLFA